ncbi:Uncharacterised protein [Legionella sainthelensi]|nr:Uncharacterised protein [Legionella sainthelensi]
MRNVSIDINPVGLIVIANCDEDVTISKIEFHKGLKTNININVIFNNEASNHR